MRLLIGVTNCHKAIYPEILNRAEPPTNASCADAARATWIETANQSSVDVKFFYGRPPAGTLTRRNFWDEVFLDVDDSYDGLTEKVTAMVAWAWEHGYDYFMKVDVDSYVNIPKLLASEFFEWDYAGRGWGLGYLLSRRAMQIVMQEKQVRSWAEDSHVLRTLFAWGDKHPDLFNPIKLYGDGRFVFLPNLLKVDVPLYDREFIAVNPMTPERMHILHETGQLSKLLPLHFTKEDLWTDGPDRIEHCSANNAFAVTRTKMPYDYNAWTKLTPYERQPFLDWSQIVFACLETDQMGKCPTFETWMGPLDYRKELMRWALDVNLASCARIKKASQHFRLAQGEDYGPRRQN